MLNLFSRYEFQKAVQEHKGERHARGISCRDQFVAMLFCHLAKAKSLREIISRVGKDQEGTFLYHLGTKLMKRSSLAYANAHRPWPIYQTVFYSAPKNPYYLRRIEAIDPKTGDAIVLLTNHLRFGASTSVPFIRIAGRLRFCSET